MLMANKKISKVTKALKFFFEKDDKFNWVAFNSIILIFSGIWAVTTLFNDNQNQSKDRINEKIVAFDIENLSTLIKNVSEYSDAAFSYNLIVVKEGGKHSWDTEELDSDILDAKKDYLNKRQNVISYLNPSNKYVNEFQGELNEMDEKLNSVWTNKNNEFIFSDEMYRKYIQEEKKEILAKVK